MINSLEAVLWAFYHTNSFEEGVLKVANLGGDADILCHFFIVLCLACADFWYLTLTESTYYRGYIWPISWRYRPFLLLDVCKGYLNDLIFLQHFMALRQYQIDGRKSCLCCGC